VARKEINYLGWSRYYVGRGFQLFGLFLVTASAVLFFGSAEMKAMLGMTGTGAFAFFVGWLVALKKPE
jgi:hypothetical protein